MTKELKTEDALKGLEERIDSLVQICRLQHAENQQLKTQQKDLIQQRKDLVEKNGIAKSHVETMISRLELMKI